MTPALAVHIVFGLVLFGAVWFLGLVSLSTAVAGFATGMLLFPVVDAPWGATGGPDDS